VSVTVLRNLSKRTRESYWWHINDYRQFTGKDPQETGVKELRAYFQSMLTDGNHKPGSVKMGYYALRFLFVNIYHKEWAKEYLPTPKVAKTLPLVLSKEEVFEVLSVIPNFKHRTVIMFIYSTGVRISECVNIKLTDIDSRRMQVNIQESPLPDQRHQQALHPAHLSALLCHPPPGTRHQPAGDTTPDGPFQPDQYAKIFTRPKAGNRPDNQPAGQTGRSGSLMSQISICNILQEYGGRYIATNRIKGQQKRADVFFRDGSPNTGYACKVGMRQQ